MQPRTLPNVTPNPVAYIIDLAHLYRPFRLAMLDHSRFSWQDERASQCQFTDWSLDLKWKQQRALCCSFRYDYVEIEDPIEKSIVGRWCGSQPVAVTHVSKGSQIKIRFISDEYLPSEPGFCIRYSLQPVVSVLSPIWITLLYSQSGN